mmetsp:Transcript_49639/g.132825  ORF Transcript_49639/g.132825 Transcript_49639/m.132825 type:complete len:217 (+) Transcript_49639:478-1128(+)
MANDLYAKVRDFEINGMARPLRQKVHDNVARTLALQYQLRLLLDGVVLAAVDGVHNEVEDHKLKETPRHGHRGAHDRVVVSVLPVIVVGVVGAEAHLLQAVAVAKEEAAVEVEGFPAVELLPAVHDDESAPDRGEDEGQGEGHLEHRQARQGVAGRDDLLAKGVADAEHVQQPQEADADVEAQHDARVFGRLVVVDQFQTPEAGVEPQEVREQECN